MRFVSRRRMFVDRQVQGALLFRAESLAHAVAYAGRMLDLFGAAPETAAAIEFGRRHAATLVAAVVPVIPAVKMSDLGLVDVMNKKLIPLFA